ncbi:MAG: phosphate regulon sensor histidine kinase PhoR [Pseudomonadota bacterium]
MRYDIWKFTTILAVAGILGFLLGFFAETVMLCAIAIIGWQIYRIDLIHKWIKNPNKHPLPVTSGQIFELHRELNRRNRTNRKRKKKLTRYVKQFRKAISALPDAIVLLDRQGKIQWANQNAYQLLGIQWPNDHDVGFTNLIRDPRVAELLARSQLLDGPAAATNVRLEGIEVSSKYDEAQTLNLKVVPHTDELLMVIARDVSRLMKVNRMHADFVANVSHELKTPLTVLRGYLEILLAEESLDDKFAKPIEQMNAQSQRMQLIVSDLLYLSKLEDLHDPASHKQVEVTQLINSIVETSQDKTASKHLKLNLDIDYRIQIIGNQNELHSAFSNLIFNAVTYTPEHGVISIKWRGAEGGGAVFSVQDNGPGIPAQHLPRLTERFYRIDADRSREGGGTGLGLAIVKHVLQRHNARLEIDSTEGFGSTFNCLFPTDQIVDRAQNDSQSG